MNKLVICCLILAVCQLGSTDAWTKVEFSGIKTLEFFKSRLVPNLRGELKNQLECGDENEKAKELCEKYSPNKVTCKNLSVGDPKGPSFKCTSDELPKQITIIGQSVSCDSLPDNFKTRITNNYVALETCRGRYWLQQSA